MAENPVLEFQNVFKKYKKKTVINNLSFQVFSHEIIAFLGVNGAGKTTTIHLMLGQELPTQGRVLLFGKNPRYPSARQQVGLTPQNVEFPEGLTAQEILFFAQAHYALSQKFSFLSEIIEKFALAPFLQMRATKLSEGQKRKLALAMAFVSNPQLVFLDEPTTGLDVESRSNLLKTIKDYAKKGNSVFLTTHYLEEIEQIATRIIFLHQGTIKAQGTVEEIKKIGISSLSQITFFCEEILSFHYYKNVQHWNLSEHIYTLHTRNPDALIYELVENKIPFSKLNIVKENLESAFLKLSKGN
jgi:ABC-2 type transport system ATP-binding protein